MATKTQHPASRFACANQNKVLRALALIVAEKGCDAGTVDPHAAELVCNTAQDCLFAAIAETYNVNTADLLFSGCDGDQSGHCVYLFYTPIYSEKTYMIVFDRLGGPY